MGGKDLPIVVYTAPATSGVRAMIKRAVMGSADFAASVKAQSSSKRAGEVVANDPAGISGTARGLLDTTKVKVIESKKVEQPMALVTLGNPKPAAKAVIDAFAKAAKSQ